jgi:hypothetical protein
MTDRELMQMALDDICGAKLCEVNSMSSRQEMLRLLDKAAEALRARLEQPEPEPVAWISAKETWLLPQLVISDKPKEGWMPVYTAPPQRGWVGLTDEERTYIAWESNNGPHCVQLTEDMLREKNSG